MTNENLQQKISKTLNHHGLGRHGWARLERPFSFDLYQSWVDNGFQGQMDYLKRHAPAKAEPTQILPQARSAIAVAINYLPHPSLLSANENPLSHVRIALYAQGHDYHAWFQEKLDKACAELEQHFPGEVFKAFTDSAPVLERDLAARAGLGWVGKNTCLIDTQAGSLFFIGEILTSLTPPAFGVLAPDRCGTCTRCLDICPTQALIEPRKLDARLCISYLNIESKAPPPIELREKIGDWMFGCDLCQTVCPWNEKAFGKINMQNEVNKPSQRDKLIQELKWILENDDKKIEMSLKSTPLLRRGVYGLRKNALIVAANKELTELVPTIEKLRETVQRKDNQLRGEKETWLLELCDWSIIKLTQALSCNPASGEP